MTFRLENSRSQCAFSLMEMLVAFGIGSLLLAAAAQLSMFTARSFAALGNYNDLDRASRNALDVMSRDIREAKIWGINASTNYAFFTNMDNSWFVYYWTPSTKTLNRYYYRNGTYQQEVVLTGCDYFSFRIWQRNPTNQFWFPYSANSQPYLTKLVDVSWRCSRRVLNQYNTESVQTAKIVLRN